MYLAGARNRVSTNCHSTPLDSTPPELLGEKACLIDAVFRDVMARPPWAIPPSFRYLSLLLISLQYTPYNIWTFKLSNKSHAKYLVL